MKPKGLLIAAVLLAVLGGLWWWSGRKQEADIKKSPDTTVKLLTIPEDQFQEIRFKRGVETLVLRRDNGKWRIAGPQPYPADPDTARSMVTSLSSVTAETTIEDKAADFGPYGLNSPALDIAVLTKDGKTGEIQVGDATPTSSGYYARVAGSPRVVTLSSYVKGSLDKSLNDLRDKRLLTVEQDKIARIQLQTTGPAVEFGRNGESEWQILQPRPLRADGGQIDSLIFKLRDAKMDLANPDPDAAKKFAAAPRVATVTVTDSNGSQTLEVHQDKDKTYYAKSSAVDGVYKIAADVGDGLNKGLDDFRNKKLFDFGFSDPGKLEIVNNGSFAYTKSGDKWMSGAKTMDNSTVQTLIDRLRDLAADKFADKGGGKTVFEATVTSNSGKRVEKVTIAAQGDRYFAQRDGDSSIYELSAKSVDDVRSAAGGIREPEPPAAAKKK
ncbi:MAG TPA: DUF4340 domain-containing protein [Bryobacteraceae bacterium]|nr:DUF4340 domain-containing protein [Bryobacteraceae bacterium]